MVAGKNDIVMRAERGEVDYYLNAGVAYTGQGFKKDMKKAIYFFEQVELHSTKATDKAIAKVLLEAIRDKQAQLKKLKSFLK